LIGLRRDLAGVKKTARQRDIFNHGQGRNQVKHLMDIANVVGPETVPVRTMQSIELTTVHLDGSPLRNNHSCDEAEQSTFAATARSGDKHPLAPFVQNSGHISTIIFEFFHAKMGFSSIRPESLH
jgi:hypothetical protein